MAGDHETALEPSQSEREECEHFVYHIHTEYIQTWCFGGEGGRRHPAYAGIKCCIRAGLKNIPDSSSLEGPSTNAGKGPSATSICVTWYSEVHSDSAPISRHMHTAVEVVGGETGGSCQSTDTFGEYSSSKC